MKRNQLAMIALSIMLTSLVAGNLTSYTNALFTQTELSLTLATDSQAYAPSDLVEIFGTVTNSTNSPVENAIVGIQVQNPNNNTVFLDIVFSSSTGAFNDSFRLPPKAVAGEYVMYSTATKTGYSTASCIGTFFVSGIIGEHEISVAETVPEKNVVGQNYLTKVNITVMNQGNNTESFNISLYCNSTLVSVQNLTITKANYTEIYFQWNTTNFSMGNYTLTTVADSLPGETNTFDNNNTSSISVHVGVPGDVSGPTQGVYDGTCNMRDIQYLIILFNTNPSSPNWKPNADINNDGTTNMRDIYIAILNFNKHE